MGKKTLILAISSVVLLIISLTALPSIDAAKPVKEEPGVAVGAVVYCDLVS